MLSWKKTLNWLLVVTCVFSTVGFAFADLLGDKTEELAALQKQITQQQQALDKARSRSATLKNQLDILDQQIKMTELQVQSLTVQIDKTTADMSRINRDLVDAEVQIYDSKKILRDAITESYMRQQTGLLEVLLGSSDLSDFISQLEYVTTIEGRITNTLSVLQDLNASLKERKGELETADKQLKQLAASKALEQNSLTVQAGAKENLLNDSKLTEAEYQKRLLDAVAEEARIQNQIAQLAKNVRKDTLNQGKYTLQWPIPSRMITATFRDGDYLARFKIPHNAIDIATPQGTPIKAPADAFVLKVKFDGSNAYSYIILDHGNGMVTVYGHVSAVSVAVSQFVPVGAVIGYTGGTPGMTGAGWLTTGPHLHFEVWMNGEAKNALNYLVD
ncbi:hypothetical protein A3K24_03340 [candidate division Kazan bacterium RIFCSPHIGHO2_01_FULL_44_14]|uniref:M23ase beta-sheet core domain-containing protein n=1 Tax=candidate division Kazan bacterium RIFCSPLOWO2_01_FULL_45_19 TaxID=1798538 RepID=A0A1F4NRB1_UNCK3|nr:hypothetical protein [uncultured bacterium]AQS30214.1 hypothetical protein [uncultured bacterium]OGB73827.1 MAG: hypothetical protein A3K51_03340 [candidate division Kazan bacterium RIFCSPLOWO2_01_FULL_45_19]OGB78072.1 MAG: hypothetical protein A3K24_03340 [candidate division Kazan bacterium RIFCSPHIGHO2_01_FULL_44_14]